MRKVGNLLFGFVRIIRQSSLVGLVALPVILLAQVPPCPADLNQRFEKAAARNPPWPSDWLGQTWANRPKYFIIVGVTKISTDDTAEEDFAIVDVKDIAATLCEMGYAPVPGAPQNAQLSGPDATRPTLLKVFEQTNQLSSLSLLIFYYSGHGFAHNKDLLLPLFDAPKLSETYSQSLIELINKLRSNYKGDLIVIIDACQSGVAADRKLFADVEDSSRIWVLTSSKSDEYSYPTTVNNVKVSAFTYYLIDALKSGGEVDVGDGLTLLGDIYTSITVKLNGLLTQKENKLPGPMTPQISDSAEVKLVAYSRDHIRNPNTSRRTLQQILEKAPAALDSVNNNIAPNPIQILSGRTVIATYDVEIGKDGDIRLIPKEIAPDGTMINTSQLSISASFYVDFLETLDSEVKLQMDHDVILKKTDFDHEVIIEKSKKSPPL